MEILVFGGSFDPPHAGHIRLADYALAHTGADEVWLMPSPLNPLKRNAPPAPAADRLEMCRLASAGHLGIRVSSFEIDNSEKHGAPAYTVDTLGMISRKCPEHHFRLLVGADNWACFDRWHSPDVIIREYGVTVYPRPGYTVEAGSLPVGVDYLVGAPLAEISSTELRNSPDSHTGFIDPQVLDYIKRKNLYR